MKIRPFFLLLFAAAGLLLGSTFSASAQIEKMSNRKLHAETRKAERQARREARRQKRENGNEAPDMSGYDMQVGAEGRKAVKTDDGRDNYQFNKKGEPMVSDAVLTRKRLKRGK
jgi:hypothetical protein